MTGSLLALIAATGVLVAIPGPNVALIVASSIRDGLRSGLVTVAGTTTGFALQLLLVAIGMVALIEYAAEVLTWIRWLGVAYLVWLGVRTFREPPADLAKVEAAPAMFWRGCLLAAVNPKTLVFNAAFFPQFIRVDAGPVEVAVVAAVYLAVVLCGDALWALFAHRARALLVRNPGWRNRATGIFLALAGIGLALAKK